LGFAGDVVPICLDESRGGRIVCCESTFPRKTRFVNSGVRKFATFLATYRRYCLAVRGKDEPTAKRLGATTQREMPRCEPAALARVAHFWSGIVEQMHQGLL